MFKIFGAKYLTQTTTLMSCCMMTISHFLLLIFEVIIIIVYIIIFYFCIKTKSFCLKSINNVYKTDKTASVLN